MLGKEFGRNPELGGLEGQGLGTVLAEFERFAAGGIGKGAAWTFETAGLVHRKQGAGALGDDTLFEQDLGRGGGRSPASCRMVVGLKSGLAVGHILGSRDARVRRENLQTHDNDFNERMLEYFENPRAR